MSVCRSTIAARDEEGKRIKIPADMTYRDWKAVYIDKTRTLEDWRKAKDAEYAAAREKAKRNPDPELVKGRQILDKLGRGEKLTPAPTLAERLVQNPNISASLRQSAERVLAKLEETRAELQIKGQIVYLPPKFDLTKFTFDIEHAQGGKHPHNVTEDDARRFIANAYFAIYSLKSESYNYYGKDGGAFVQPNNKKIRTAFKSEEYNPKIRRLIEVFENEIGEA